MVTTTATSRIWRSGIRAFIRVGPEGGRPDRQIWFRAEVRGLERMPPTGGALLVKNASGGAMTPDVLVLAPAFYEAGLRPPAVHLGAPRLFQDAAGRDTAEDRRHPRATRGSTAQALSSGGVVLVFPGGDYARDRSTFWAEHHRLQRPKGIRAHGHWADVPDRVSGVDRRPGDPAVLGRGTRILDLAGVAEDPGPTSCRWASVFPFGVTSTIQLPAAVEGRARVLTLFTLSISSVRIRMSTRSTRMCAR